MVSLSDGHGEFIDFFDNRGDALVYAALFGIATPFRIEEI